jgi:predicted DNA-binding transcriptional regulator YafY
MAASTGRDGTRVAWRAMSTRRTERLLNLVIALLATRRWLTKEQIRQAVPQYAECSSTEAFDRMFERDKDELRELGVPLLTGSGSAWFEDEVGYRIDPNAYALPEISFTPSELAVLGLASRVWQQASLGGPAARALVKLKALGIDPDEASLVGVEPRVRTSEPAFDPLYAATRDRAPVSFRYRSAGASTSAVRTVEPWQITSWHGHWYLVGHDRDRQAPRVFRLSRVEGRVTRAGEPGSSDVPAGLDARAMVSGAVGRQPERTARVRLAAGAGSALRLRAGAAGAAGSGPGVVDVPFTDAEELAEQVVWIGAGAVVEAPDDVRDAVLRRLRGAARAHGAARPARAPAKAAARR